MKNVIYFLTQLSHKREIESFKEHSDLNQLVLGPVPKITTGIVSEDYSDFGIKNIKFYNNKQEAQKVINEFSPDIFAEASVPVASGLNLPKNCKKVFISQGLVGTHMKHVIKQAGIDKKAKGDWAGCDLYCGATKNFIDWMKSIVPGINDNKILLNALPEIDLVYPEYFNKYKEKILLCTKNPKADKTLLFLCFEGKDRIDYLKHNEDYFWAAIEMEKIARKNNWLLMIKAKHYKQQTIDFLSKYSHWGWPKKYINDYKTMLNSKNIHFIETTGHMYRYLFSDIIIVNATSSAEIEACIAKKPLVIIRTKVGKEYDPYGTISNNSGVLVDKMSTQELENALKKSLKLDLNNERKKFLENYHELIIDKCAYKRIQERILKL